MGGMFGSVVDLQSPIGTVLYTYSTVAPRNPALVPCTVQCTYLPKVPYADPAATVTSSHLPTKARTK